MNIFEYASKNRVRFEYKGVIGVEDLWSLKVEELDSIYKSLVKQQKDDEGESLLSPVAKNIQLSIKIDIVKHIVSVKQDEAKEKAAAKENKERKQRIAEILAEKKDEVLKNLSVEELEKLL